MKTFLTHFIGFVGYFFLEGFIRLIIMFYHSDEFHYYGIENLPGASWITVIYISMFVSTWLITMIILSVLEKTPFKHAAIFFGIFIFWRIIEIINSIHSEPSWYLFTVPLVHLTAIYTAYKLYTSQYEKITTS
ncbi:MAG: hypothetical protein FH748_08860 [Balneolaceae bacterium]|nr:hypothetical protein [Balneolaceae bacterium]